MLKNSNNPALMKVTIPHKGPSLLYPHEKSPGTTGAFDKDFEFTLREQP
jgi:hypothetical protein